MENLINYLKRTKNIRLEWVRRNWWWMFSVVMVSIIIHSTIIIKQTKISLLSTVEAYKAQTEELKDFVVSSDKTILDTIFKTRRVLTTPQVNINVKNGTGKELIEKNVSPVISLLSKISENQDTIIQKIDGMRAQMNRIDDRVFNIDEKRISILEDYASPFETGKRMIITTGASFLLCLVVFLKLKKKI